MRWHAEILIHAILAVWMWRKPDGRPKFSAWLVTRFLFDVAQLVAERSGYRTEAVAIWYLGILIGVPLLLLAMHEASDSREALYRGNIVKLKGWHQAKCHRRILFGWVACTMGAAWIRFFPYTGQAVLVIDAAAYVAWTAEKAVRSKPRQ